MKKYLLLGLSLILGASLWAQEKKISGKVTDAETGEAVPGANVIVKGTTNGTITDFDGKYELSVGSDATLIYSFVGYAPKEVVVGNQSVINVGLDLSVEELAEVVVIGYGEVEKGDATGSIASVKAEDFNGGVIASPEQLIQGKAAGVQITNNGGEPGSGVSIRIRGTSSVRSGNNPLFVVDGVPLAGDDVSGGGENFGLGSQSAKNPLNFLNPADIASIDILKDASATAIYGSRGANGVVIITTKNGKGASQLDYSYSLGVSSITKKYDLLGASEFLSAYEDFNDAAAAATINGGTETDWQDEIFRTAISQTHQLSFGGSDPRGDNYRMSLSYSDQEGIVDQNNMKRITARFNNSKSFINNRLTVTSSMTIASVTDNHVPITDNAGFEGDLLGNILKANPTQPVKNADGTYNQLSSTEPNPRAMLDLSKDFTNTIRGLGSFSAAFKILDALSFKSVYGIDRSFSGRKTVYSGDLLTPGTQPGGVKAGRGFTSDIEVNNTLWENYFTYNQKLGNTKVNAVVGYSYQKFDRSSKVFEMTNFRTTDLDLMLNNMASVNIAGNPNSVVVRNSSKVIDELQSYFTRVNFDISDKYVLTATVRADGSTKFGSGNKYGVFPSFGAKWRVSEEAFAPSMFSDLSLRAGWGITGNQEIPHNVYQQRQRYSDYDLDNNGNVSGGGLGDVAFQNPDLQWEETSQFSVGVEYGFLDNRLRGSVDFYNKVTTDLLIQVTSAQPAINPFVWQNLDADVVNTGWEFQLEYDLISTSDLKWTFSGNIAFNHNEVQNFDGQLNTAEINGQGLTGAYAQRIADGQPLFAYFLREFGGFDENGISVYPNGDFQEFTGDSPLPTTTLGITNTLKYKSFDMSFFFNGMFGHSIYSNTANAFFTAGSLANGRNVTKDVVGNGESNLNAPDVSTRFLEKADFLRLQNVSLGYNIDVSGISWIGSLRVFATGQNLFVITDYSGQDPEVNTNKPTTLSSFSSIPSFGIDYTPYPRARTFTFGVNISL